MRGRAYDGFAGSAPEPKQILASKIFSAATTCAASAAIPNRDWCRFDGEGGDQTEGRD